MLCNVISGRSSIRRTMSTAASSRISPVHIFATAAPGPALSSSSMTVASTEPASRPTLTIRTVLGGNWPFRSAISTTARNSRTWMALIAMPLVNADSR